MDLDAIVGFHFEDDSLIEAGYAFREYYRYGCCLGTSKDTKADFSLVQWQTSRSIIRLMLVSDEFSTEFGVLHLSRVPDRTSSEYLS